MAGIWTNIYDDSNTISQQIRDSVNINERYRLQPESYQVNLMGSCLNNVEINTTWNSENWGYLTDVESNLKDIVYYDDDGNILRKVLSKDNNPETTNKHKICDVNNMSRNCVSKVVANPFSCDRDINPTNMRMPVNKGFVSQTGTI